MSKTPRQKRLTKAQRLAILSELLRVGRAVCQCGHARDSHVTCTNGRHYRGCHVCESCAGYRPVRFALNQSTETISLKAKG